jgi:hypothetical protein
MTSATLINSEDLYVALQQSGPRPVIESDSRLLNRETVIKCRSRTAQHRDTLWRAEILPLLTYPMITLHLGESLWPLYLNPLTPSKG